MPILPFRGILCVERQRAVKEQQYYNPWCFHKTEFDSDKNVEGLAKKQVVNYMT